MLLHGVGPGPEAFAETAALLSARHRVLVPERPWEPGAAPSLDDQASAIVAAVGEPAAFVGVSGGATLAVRLAAIAPDAVASLVVHEPLLGHHAPTLAARFREAAAAVRGSDDNVLRVLRGVMGDATWSRLGRGSRERILADLDRVRAEVGLFAAFDPTTEELAALRRLPILTTVGGESGPERAAAADVLVSLAGASSAVVDGAGNLPHVDAPAAFAALVDAFVSDVAVAS